MWPRSTPARTCRAVITLYHAVRAVKAFQATRFRATYADLLATPRFEPAVLFFFLNELYSDKDYTQRDAQFVRIAGPLERLFPNSMVDTAVAMAHCTPSPNGWTAPWRRPGWMRRSLRRGRCLRVSASGLCARPGGKWAGARARLSTRHRLACGRDLVVTRKRGLRTLLSLMRPPRASGLGALAEFSGGGL